jgi:hypothetical protein
MLEEEDDDEYDDEVRDINIKNVIIQPPKKETKPKKTRVVAIPWDFQLSHSLQLQWLDIIDPIIGLQKEKEVTIMVQQIRGKINGYKRQDVLKYRYNASLFITMEDVIGLMRECKLTCKYCLRPIFVLYDISFSKTQWTVDRIDNSLGHQRGNCHLACLECNLSRRRMGNIRFMLGKQFSLIKMDG